MQIGDALGGESILIGFVMPMRLSHLALSLVLLLCGFLFTHIHCGIIHGCLEYSEKYPDYKYSEDGPHRSFSGPKSWDEVEEKFFANREFEASHIDHHNKQGISIRDVIGFRTWVRYAELIGDTSCEKFLGGTPYTLPQNFTAHAAKLAPIRQSEM